MSQNIELNKIKNRIKALVAKTVDAGCTEEEAVSAAAMVGKLLEQYNLSLDEIEVRESKCQIVKLYTETRHTIAYCCRALSNFTDTKSWMGREWKDNNRPYIAFFGKESDIDCVEYLFRVIYEAMNNEVNKYKQSLDYHRSYSKRTASSSFLLGMAGRISERLNTMKRENEETLRRAHEQRMKETNMEAHRVSEIFGYTPAERQASRITGTSLVVLKKQLVEQEFAKQGIKLVKKAGSRRSYDPNSYSLGMKAGEKVNLNRPIGSDGGPQGYLE